MKKVFAVLALAGIVMSAPAFADATKLPEFKKQPSSLSSTRDTTQGYAAPVAFMTDGQTRVHLAAMDLAVAFRTKHGVNPLERGHIAFRTDDIEAFKKRLEAKNVFYSDYGLWAMNGWFQIFFYDPAGNVIEPHQVIKE